MSPIVLFVFNRPEHTRRVLESLAKADGAAASDLHIFSDGALTDSDTAAVAKVREVCHGARGFASVSVTERERHYGQAANIVGGVSDVIGQRGTAIVVEDDVTVAPFFLRYMNAALEFYRGRGVFSIVGHTPAEVEMPKEFPFSTFVMHRHNPWGWATWKSEWDKVDWECKTFDAFIRDAAARHRFNEPGDDLTPALLRWRTGHDELWDAVLSYAAFRAGEPHVYPRKSLVRHVVNDATRVDAPLAANVGLNDFCPGVATNAFLVEQFHRVYSTSAAGRVANMLRRWRYLILGR